MTTITSERARFLAGEKLTTLQRELEHYATLPAERHGAVEQDEARARAVAEQLAAEIRHFDAEQDAAVEAERRERKAQQMAGHIAAYQEAITEFEAAQEDLIRASEVQAAALERFREQAAGLDRLETLATGRSNGDRVFTDQQRQVMTYVARLLYRTPLTPALLRHQPGLDAPRPVFVPAQVWTPAQDAERAEATRRREAQEAKRAAELAAQPHHLYGTPSDIGAYFSQE